MEQSAFFDVHSSAGGSMQSSRKQKEKRLAWSREMPSRGEENQNMLPGLEKFSEWAREAAEFIFLLGF